MAAVPVIAIVAIVMIGASAYILCSDLRFPPVIASVVWAAVLVAYQFRPSMYPPLTPETYFVVCAGVLSFAAGGLLAGGHLGELQGFHDLQSARRSSAFLEWRTRVWRSLVIAAPLVALPFAISKALSIRNGSPLAIWPSSLHTRLASTGATGFYGILAYCGPVALVALLTEAALAERLPTWRFWFALLGGLLWSLLTTGRTTLFALLIGLVGVLSIQGRIQIRTAIAAVGLGGATAFVGIAILLDKWTASTSSQLPFSQVVTQTFYVYALSPLAALSQFLGQHRELDLGQHTFRTLVALAHRLNLSGKAVPLVQPFVRVPYQTNVYTVHEMYIADFGLLGTLLAQTLFGASHSYCYRKARRGSAAAAVLYALLLYPLIMQFFQDQYFSLLSTWLQYGVALVIVFVCSRILPRITRSHGDRALV